MEKRAFGKTDMEVSVLGFGGAEIGFSGATAETVDRLLGSALDAGLNFIDTAECYGNSEELIGKTMSHRRNDFYLITKCGHASGFEAPDWDPQMLSESIDRSLTRLNTDRLDVVLLHSCSKDLLKQGDVIEVLERAKEQGKTRYIGYSGDSDDALFAIQTNAFDVFETSLNIADQQAIELTLPEAQQRGMGVIAKRPIANVAWKSGEKPDNEYIQEYWERLQHLQYDFLDNELTASVEKALRFTLSTPGVHTAIVGTQNPERWTKNAQLLAKGALPKDEYDAIRNEWRKQSQENWVGQV
ncbi:aldo/keto reductase [Fictibacillus enclensis]|uniref:aldo/keto reductase n=1 Tax=Fictibacillus enclensis TaxID=1017270 RepID=UPI0025A1C7F7|nr:aldo/keto reductase [Fictibacillus enclensis]MDM5339805.1 aldo/keto reductase [Fictibacillus enclensis]